MPAKGFGFIEPVEHGGADVFMHHAQLQNCNIEDLDVGDLMEYELRQSAKGPRAMEVVFLEKDQHVPRGDD